MHGQAEVARYQPSSKKRVRSHSDVAENDICLVKSSLRPTRPVVQLPEMFGPMDADMRLGVAKSRCLGLERPAVGAGDAVVI